MGEQRNVPLDLRSLGLQAQQRERNSQEPIARTVGKPIAIRRRLTAKPRARGKARYSSLRRDLYGHVAWDTQKTGTPVNCPLPIVGGHAHRFRDPFAISLLLKGVDLANVSVLLGHGSIKVTERHYSPWVKARQERLEADVRSTWAPPVSKTKHRRLVRGPKRNSCDPIRVQLVDLVTAAK